MLNRFNACHILQQWYLYCAQSRLIKCVGIKLTFPGLWDLFTTYSPYLFAVICLPWPLNALNYVQPDIWLWL